MMRPGEHGPLFRVLRLAHQRERGDGESRSGNEVVVLREAEPSFRTGSKLVVDEPGVAFERLADSRTLGGGEVVVEQVVGPSDRVQQVTGREIGVGLVVGIAPRLVVDGRQRPLLCRGQILRLALHGVGQRRFGDGERDVVLRAPLLRSGDRRRRTLHGRQVRRHLRPLVAMRGSRALAQHVEFGPGHEDPRMDADQFRFERHLVREQFAERGDGLLRVRRSSQQSGQNEQGGCCH